MKNVYYIGRFEFDSYTEYKKGLEDVKKIKYISEEVDINEPGVALRLYTLIRQNEITFQSVIGEDYLLYLSDLVADDYKELSTDESPSYLANLGRTRSPRRFAGILCIVLAAICFVYFLGTEIADHRKARELKELQESKEISEAAQYIADVINDKINSEEEKLEESVSQMEEPQSVVPEETEPVVLPEYVDLYTKNADMVGWIAIPGTAIDYPVMQSKDPAEPYYYLNHNFSKEEDVNGSIFLDQRNHPERKDSNLIIYGHNMRSGLMFGSLKSYLEKDYLAEHPQIEFHTLYEKRKYQIVAVCLAEVEYQDEEGFRYYNFTHAETQQAFDEFKRNITNMNVYSGEIDITYGDEMITLSTCNNYTEDGRMFIVAKRVE